MANTSLLLTLIADDRPGLVGELSALISAHGGSWLESSLAQLAGKFAGIVRITLDASKVGPLQKALDTLPQLHIAVTALDPAPAGGPSTSLEHAATAKSAPAGSRLRLDLVGNDRLGIVKELSAVLARHGINVEKLETRTESGAMSAGMLFRANAELMAPPDLDVHGLQAELEKISNDLMVEISLAKTLL